MTKIDYPNLSSEKQEAFEELRKKIGSIQEPSLHDGNHCFYRFLKARDFKADKAEDMLRNTLKWRKETGVATIFDDYKPAEALRIAFENTRVCYDKEGCPVFFIPVGRLDINGILSSIRDSDIERMFVRFMEKAERILQDQTKKLNTPITRMSFIGDMEGLNFANATNKKAIEALIRIVQMQQDNYPERLKSIFILHASSFFTLPYSIIKLFIAAELIEKIHVFGSNTESWKDALWNEMDENDLPVFLGGKKAGLNGDPTGKTIVYQGGKIDEKLYIRKKKKSLLSSAPNVKKLTIARGSVSEVVVDVPDKDSIIEWEFETKTRDVGFGLFTQETIAGKPTLTELVPLQRLDTEVFPETGMYRCEKAGKYVLFFDNSYSWIRSKEVYYRFNVITAIEHKEKIQDKSIKIL